MFVCQFGCVVKHFLSQLLMAPLNVLRISYKIITRCALFIPNLISKIPLSAYVGLGVLTICYLLYCRLNFYLALRKLRGCSQRAFRLINNHLRAISQKIASVFNRSTSPKSFFNELSPVKSDQGRCVVCMEAVVSFMSMPCRHVCLCNGCVHRIIEVDNRCPMCRRRVVQYDKVFLS